MRRIVLCEWYVDVKMKSFLLLMDANPIGISVAQFPRAVPFKWTFTMAVVAYVLFRCTSIFCRRYRFADT